MTTLHTPSDCDRVRHGLPPCRAAARVRELEKLVAVLSEKLAECAEKLARASERSHPVHQTVP